MYKLFVQATGMLINIEQLSLKVEWVIDEGERDNCFSEIQLVGLIYLLMSLKTRQKRHQNAKAAAIVFVYKARELATSRLSLIAY